MAGGRPTKYDPKYCEEIIKYFDVPPINVLYKKEYFMNGELKSEVPILTGAEFPTFQGFAHKIDVAMSTLQEWCLKHEEFSAAYARAKAIQEKIWLTNGMGNLYNSQFAQFFGKNCLGYTDKQEIESTNTNITVELTPAERAKRIKELKAKL